MKRQTRSILEEIASCAPGTTRKNVVENKSGHVLEGAINLIKEFYKITSVPMLLNTSLNLAGDTIVETVDDAINTLNISEMDYLYFPENNVIIVNSKNNQRI